MEEEETIFPPFHLLHGQRSMGIVVRRQPVQTAAESDNGEEWGPDRESGEDSDEESGSSEEEDPGEPSGSSEEEDPGEPVIAPPIRYKGQAKQFEGEKGGCLSRGTVWDSLRAGNELSQVHICNIQDQFPMPVCALEYYLSSWLFQKAAWEERQMCISPSESHLLLMKKWKQLAGDVLPLKKNVMFGGALGSDLLERPNIYSSCRIHSSRFPVDRLGLLWLPCTGKWSWKAATLTEPVVTFFESHHCKGAAAPHAKLNTIQDSKTRMETLLKERGILHDSVVRDCSLGNIQARLVPHQRPILTMVEIALMDRSLKESCVQRQICGLPLKHGQNFDLDVVGLLTKPRRDLSIDQWWPQCAKNEEGGRRKRGREGKGM
ncbi:hypothetical protein L345_01479, partial [Ophiophagus hannah]